MEKKKERDLVIEIIEMFRTCNCCCITKVGFKKLVGVVDIVLNNLHYSLE